MKNQQELDKPSRRTLLKLVAATGAWQLASPFIIKARADTPIKFGLCNPLTGTYAQLGKNEQIGCELAIEQINAKGGVCWGESVGLACRGV